MVVADVRYRTVLLDTFKKLISFFEIHNIEWWAAYGTLIGAIRHKGLIPWDDDVDIWVPREDYDRLLSMQGELKSHGLIIHSPELNDGYYLGMAKICDCNSSVWEHRILPYVFGVFIDIFPIECTDCTRQDVLRAQSEYQLSLNRLMGVLADYQIRDYLSALRHGALDTLMDRMHHKRVLNAIRDGLLQSTRCISNSQSGNYMATLYGTENVPDFFKREWFGESLSVPFEDFNVNVPTGYHEVLTSLYGDYMTPPPAAERESTHEKYYLNLNEHLSIEEIKKRIHKGERLVY